MVSLLPWEPDHTQHPEVKFDSSEDEGEEILIPSGDALTKYMPSLQHPHSQKEEAIPPPSPGELPIVENEELTIPQSSGPLFQINLEDEAAIGEEIEWLEVYEVDTDEEEDFIDLQPAPQEMEEGGQATVDKLIEMNLGDVDDPRPVFVSALLSEDEREAYRQLLLEFKDCFAWTYKEMPGLDPSVAEHELSILPNAKPVKQPPRRMRPELEEKVNPEVEKMYDVDFIETCMYPVVWLANIVPVRKKNGQVRICVDFRDLNKACPKDDFPVPNTEMMVDVTTGHEALSFMDGSSGYNQIRMAEKEQILTA